MAKGIQLQQKFQTKQYIQKPSSVPLPQPDNTQKKVRNRTLGGLIIFSLAAIVFSVWFIQGQLAKPFENTTADTDTDTATTATAGANQATNAATLGQLESLREKDTDNDGISDYDELYIYKTSPYLDDSDSDTIKDGMEIDQGTDPNCPEGTDCGRTVPPDSNTNDALADSLLTPINVNASIVDPENLSADELRNILRDAGVSEISLQELDDETLLQTYQNILQEEELANKPTANTNATGNTNTGEQSAISYEQLQNLTPDEIRQLLVQNGIDESLLDTLDDETLQQVYLESLEQNLDQSN